MLDGLTHGVDCTTVPINKLCSHYYQHSPSRFFRSPSVNICFHRLPSTQRLFKHNQVLMKHRPLRSLNCRKKEGKRKRHTYQSKTHTHSNFPECYFSTAGARKNMRWVLLSCIYSGFQTSAKTSLMAAFKVCLPFMSRSHKYHFLQFF